LSLVEVFTSIYFNGKVDVKKIKNNSADRDRIILSKGHGGLGLYCTLMKAGIMERSMLDGFASIDGRLSTHPVYGAAKGIEMSSGSLGQGMGFACGTALAGKLSNLDYETYVIVGDGELQEGSNWESMLFASQLKLDNLTLIVDRNRKQISGDVDDIVSLSPLKEKLESFGFYTVEVDGHNLDEIENALVESHDAGPKAMIANTVKGKGISFIADKNGWHGKGLTLEQYKKAMEELGALENG
jgi:transketolase